MGFAGKSGDSKGGVRTKTLGKIEKQRHKRCVMQTRRPRSMSEVTRMNRVEIDDMNYQAGVSEKFQTELV